MECRMECTWVACSILPWAAPGTLLLLMMIVQDLCDGAAIASTTVQDPTTDRLVMGVVDRLSTAVV